MMRLTFVLSGSHEGCLGTLGYGVFLEFAWRKSVLQSDCLTVVLPLRSWLKPLRQYNRC